MFTRSRMMQAAGNAGGPVEIALTISSDTHNYNIYTNRGGDYEAGNSIITLTINSGIYVGSTSTGTAGLIIPSDFDAGDQINIINNGFIVGMGGVGGTGQCHGNYTAPTAGGAGGPAILASRAVTITNNGTVAGGGGGGGGGGGRRYCGYYFYGSCSEVRINRGNGGGGGQGYNGGAGGAVCGNVYSGSASAGIGSAGTKTSPGSSGSQGSNNSIAAGAGGGLGAAGGTGGAGTGGASMPAGGAGGAAGNYANGNSNITWATTGTRLGGVS